jgi:hypothetical protein
MNEDEAFRVPSMQQISEIDVGYLPKIEAGWFAVQRVGWFFMVACVIGGLAGVFGRGPLAQVRESTNSGVGIGYEKVLRFKTPTSLSVQIPDSYRDKLVKIFLSNKMLKQVPYNDISPRPTRQIASQNGITFMFARDSNAPMSVQFAQQPVQAGAVYGVVQVGSEQPIPVNQFVFP